MVLGRERQHTTNVIELQIEVVRDLFRRLAKFGRFRDSVDPYSRSLDYGQPAKLAGNGFDKRAIRPVNFHVLYSTRSH
jgi:hypothetical protein